MTPAPVPCRALVTPWSLASMAGAAACAQRRIWAWKGIFPQGELTWDHQSERDEGKAGRLQITTMDSIPKADERRDIQRAWFVFPSKPSPLGETPAVPSPPNASRELAAPSHSAERAEGRRRWLDLDSLRSNDEKQRGWGKQQPVSHELPMGFPQLLSS